MRKNLDFDKSRLPARFIFISRNCFFESINECRSLFCICKWRKGSRALLIEEIIDRNGDVVYQREKKDLQQVIDPRIAFLISDILQEASTRGTARKVSELKRRDFAGKTGTTNDAESTWFTGYNNSLVTTVWAGFDQPRSLGNREFGSSVALPIWLSFTKEIIDQIPVNNTLPPEGLSIIKIDKSTGKRADKETKNSIFEYYLEEHTPD